MKKPTPPYPTRVEPRPYQQRIIAKAAAAFCQKGLRSVLIESPTGSGKTVMGLLIARAVQEDLGLRIGWVAMRRNLLAQAAAENEARGIGVEATFLSMFDKDPPLVSGGYLGAVYNPYGRYLYVDVKKTF